MKLLKYMQKNIVKFSLTLFCCFFILINVNAIDPDLAIPERTNINYAADPDTGHDRSCANKVKTKVTDVTGGITCVYGKWFFYQKKEGDTKVYEPYLLTSELKLAAFLRNNLLPLWWYKDYYAPLEKIGGEYSYCDDANRTVVDSSKGFDGLHTPVTLKSNFAGDITNVVYFGRSLDYTPTNNDVRDINNRGNIRDYYAQQFNAGTSKNCPTYLAVSLPAKGVIMANALDQYNDNTLSSLASTNGITFTNYLNTDIDNFRSPRSYIIENGKYSGITEILPLIENTNQKAGYSFDDMNAEASQMGELITEISDIDKECSQYPEEASRILAAVKAKVKSIEMHGFKPKADSQGSYGPGIVSQQFINNYLTIRGSDDPNYNIFEEPANKACNFFHKITTFEKIKTLELGEINLTCENLADASGKYTQLITKYNEELEYWKDKDAAFHSTILAKKQQIESEKQQFDDDFTRMSLACAAGNEKEFEEIAEEVENKMQNDFSDLYNIVNEYSAKELIPEPITCEDFGAGFLVDIFRYMTIAGTILLIVFGTIDFAKASLSFDESAIKTAGKNFAKRLLAAVILFLLPLIVGVIINIGEAAGVFEETPVECSTNR